MRVSTYGPQRVTPTRLPGPPATPTISPQAYGSGVGNTLFKLGMQTMDRANKTKAYEAVAAAKDRTRLYLSGDVETKQVGVLTAGRALLDDDPTYTPKSPGAPPAPMLGDSLTDAWRRDLDKITDGLSPRQQELARAELDTLRRNGDEKYAAAFRQQSMNRDMTALDVAVEKAVNYAAEFGYVEEQWAVIEEDLGDMANDPDYRAALPQGWLEQQTTDRYNQLHEARLDHLLANDQHETAMQHLEKHGDSMDANVVSQYTARAKESAERSADDALASDVSRDYPLWLGLDAQENAAKAGMEYRKPAAQLSTALAAVENDPDVASDPARLKRVKADVTQRHKAELSRQSSVQEEIANEFGALIAAGGAVEDVEGDPRFRYLEPGQVAQLHAIGKNKLGADTLLKQRAMLDSNNPAVREEALNTNLWQWFGAVTDEALMSALNKQGAARKERDKLSSPAYSVDEAMTDLVTLSEFKDEKATDLIAHLTDALGAEQVKQSRQFSGTQAYGYLLPFVDDRMVADGFFLDDHERLMDAEIEQGEFSAHQMLWGHHQLTEFYGNELVTNEDVVGYLRARRDAGAEF